MTDKAIDDYLAALDDPKRTTLADLRRTILELQPGALECISYGLPAFRLEGKLIAGFGAFERHLSYFPHSGSVLDALGDDVIRYATSKGTLRFAIDTPLPRKLVARLLEVRINEALHHERR